MDPRKRKRADATQYIDDILGDDDDVYYEFFEPNAAKKRKKGDGEAVPKKILTKEEILQLISTPQEPTDAKKPSGTKNPVFVVESEELIWKEDAEYSMICSFATERQALLFAVLKILNGKIHEVILLFQTEKI